MMEHLFECFVEPVLRATGAKSILLQDCASRELIELLLDYSLESKVKINLAGEHDLDLDSFPEEYRRELRVLGRKDRGKDLNPQVVIFDQIDPQKVQRNIDRLRKQLTKGRAHLPLFIVRGNSFPMAEYLKRVKFRSRLVTIAGFGGLHLIASDKLLKKKRVLRHFFDAAEELDVVLQFTERLEQERERLLNDVGENRQELSLVRKEFWEKQSALQREKFVLLDRIAELEMKIEPSSNSETDTEIYPEAFFARSQSSISERVSNGVLTPEVVPASAAPNTIEAFDSLQDEVIRLRREESSLRGQLANAQNDFQDVRDDLIKLQQWLAEIQQQITSWRHLTRWKVGDAIGSIYHRLFGDPNLVLPTEKLDRLMLDFNAWNYHFLDSESKIRRLPRRKVNELSGDSSEPTAVAPAVNT